MNSSAAFFAGTSLILSTIGGPLFTTEAPLFAAGMPLASGAAPSFSAGAPLVETSSPRPAVTPVEAASAQARRGVSMEPNVDPALTQNVTGDEAVAPAGERVQIGAGHVDMGATIMDGFELMARDDTAESPVWRHLNDVVFVIGQEGKLEVPSDPAYEFTRAKGEAWVVPQHEIAGVPWLGWNTQHPKLLELAPEGVDLIFEGHEGPGVLTTFVEAGNFSGPQVIWDSTLTHSQAIHIEPATHTHVSWVFTEPGEHLVRVTAQAKVDGELVSNTQVLRFAVGPQASAERAHELQWPTENAVSAGEEEQSAEARPEVEGETNVALSVGVGLAIAAAVLTGGGLVLRRANRARKEEALS